MDLLEIYADEAGETHFRKASIAFEPNHYVPPSPTMPSIPRRGVLRPLHCHPVRTAAR